MGNEHRRAIKSGDEQDVHTPWRRVYCYLQRAGAASAAKRVTRRRERREGQDVTRNAWKEQ